MGPRWRCRLQDTPHACRKLVTLFCNFNCNLAAGKLIAVALLDSTIKLFFTDTLKFFLSLYGHKLPVLSMDISSDSTLLVSGAADKNIKIWGLDFGDCHRSLFAHADSVMQVAFVRNTHYVFTAGESCRSPTLLLKCKARVAVLSVSSEHL